MLEADNRVVLRARRLITDGVEIEGGWVAIEAGRIATVGSGPPPPARKTIDAGAYLVPGYVDMHVHGGAGYAFDDGPESIAHGLAFHRAHGTTRTLLSLVSANAEQLRTRLAQAAAVASEDPGVLGVHLEGPYLEPEFGGAHNRSVLRSPSPQGIDRLLEAADGHLVQVTMAPEIAGADVAIAQLLQAGVRVAVGHTGATYDQATAAFDAGASILTHAFNGMRPIHHRSPGPVLAALDHPGVTLEVIHDGDHVHGRMVRLLNDTAAQRLAYITDAMAAAGCADGKFEIGGLDVIVADGVPRLASTGSIAGSTLTMDAAVRNSVNIGIPLAQAIASATAIPARALGVGDRYGALREGLSADVLALDEDLGVTQVWVGGEQQLAVAP